MGKRGKGERCTYCRRVMDATGARTGLAATRDHVIPAHMGGRTTVWACITCNGMKGGMMPEVWEAFMLDNPQWWRERYFKVRRRPHAYRDPELLRVTLIADDALRAIGDKKDTEGT